MEYDTKFVDCATGNDVLIYEEGGRMLRLAGAGVGKIIDLYRIDDDTIMVTVGGSWSNYKYVVDCPIQSSSKPSKQEKLP